MHTQTPQIDSQNEQIPLPPPPVTITEKAAEMVRQAREQEDMPQHGLRVGVIGGGCSGLQYLLDFSESASQEDWVSEQHGIPIFVDPFSAAHLNGTVVDYVDGLNESGFKFENPNIQRSCGCGSSFQT